MIFQLAVFLKTRRCSSLDRFACNGRMSACTLLGRTLRMVSMHCRISCTPGRNTSIPPVTWLEVTTCRTNAARSYWNMSFLSSNNVIANLIVDFIYSSDILKSCDTFIVQSQRLVMLSEFLLLFCTIFYLRPRSKGTIIEGGDYIFEVSKGIRFLIILVKEKRLTRQ